MNGYAGLALSEEYQEISLNREWWAIASDSSRREWQLSSHGRVLHTWNNGRRSLMHIAMQRSEGQVSWLCIFVCLN
jgi:hypothetical protein